MSLCPMLPRLYLLSAQVHSARRTRDGCLQPEPRPHLPGVRELFLQSTPGCFLFSVAPSWCQNLRKLPAFQLIECKNSNSSPKWISVGGFLEGGTETFGFREACCWPVQAHHAQAQVRRKVRLCAVDRTKDWSLHTVL